MTEINTIIFDFDGTLLDSFGNMYQAAEQAFAKLKLPSPGKQQIMSYLHSGIQLETILQKESYRHDQAIDVRLWVDTFYSVLQQSSQVNQPYPGVIDGIKQLSENGLLLNIASNRSKASIESILEYWGLITYFDCITGDQAGYELKPNPAMFTEYIQPQYPSSNLDNFLMVGDTPTDLQFAANCNIACVLMQYGGSSTQNSDNEALKPMKIFTSFEQLLTWL